MRNEPAEWELSAYSNLSARLLIGTSMHSAEPLEMDLWWAWFLQRSEKGHVLPMHVVTISVWTTLGNARFAFAPESFGRIISSQKLKRYKWKRYRWTQGRSLFRSWKQGPGRQACISSEDSPSPKHQRFFFHSIIWMVRVYVGQTWHRVSLLYPLQTEPLPM